MDKSIKKLQGIHLHPTTPLRLAVWRIRRVLRTVTGTDVLDTTKTSKPRLEKLRNVYLTSDALLLKYLPRVQRNTPRSTAMKRVRDMLEIELGYRFDDVDIKRPWGGYFRVVSSQTSTFLQDFFPGLTEKQARLGLKDVELSPKIMVILPGRRLSWQYHHRRAERWHFLTDGNYYRGAKDTLPTVTHAKAGEVIQFAQGERHRGGAPAAHYVIIAEIWQHTDPKQPSNESDVVRLEDDFKRPKRPKPY